MATCANFVHLYLVGAKNQWKKKLFNRNQRGMKEQHWSLPEYDRKRMAIGMTDFEI